MKNHQDNQSGKFVISLDFELFWGVRDKRTLDSYGGSIRKVHSIVPRLLDIFKEYGAKATFATVGFLFAENKKELLRHIPEAKPNYVDDNLSPYLQSFAEVKETSSEDPFHYAPNLIKAILEDGNHEVGTHTFSHYYCLEQGQTAEAFKEDLGAAISISSSYNKKMKSIVFPRNQVNREYLKICAEQGISSYRGNEKIWFNKADSESDTSLLKRICRTLDCYLNISGHHSYGKPEIQGELPLNIRSSRFLRPYNKRVPFLEFLKIHRIKKSMTHAARNNEIFHLWWHPHNFGSHTEENFRNLRKILEHYSYLNKTFGFESMTMEALAAEGEKP